MRGDLQDRRRPRCSRSACRSGYARRRARRGSRCRRHGCCRGCREDCVGDIASVSSAGKQRDRGGAGSSPRRMVTGRPASPSRPDERALPLDISRRPWPLAGPARRSRRAPGEPPGRGRRDGAKAEPVEDTAARSGPRRSPSRSPFPAPQAAAIWPSVSAPVSPNAPASLAPPKPTESITMRMARLKRSGSAASAARRGWPASCRGRAHRSGRHRAASACRRCRRTGPIAAGLAVQQPAGAWSQGISLLNSTKCVFPEATSRYSCAAQR